MAITSKFAETLKELVTAELSYILDDILDRQPFDSRRDPKFVQRTQDLLHIYQMAEHYEKEYPDDFDGVEPTIDND